MSSKIINTISLSSGIAGDPIFINRYNIGIKRIKKIFPKYKVIPTPNSLKGSIFLDKNYKDKANDINSCLDKNDRLVISNIGGFDSNKIIPLVNKKDLINSNLRLLGYSDMTSFHLFFIQYSKKCFYGPSVLDGFAENKKMHKYTRKYLLKALSGKKYKISQSKKWTSEYLEWEDNKTSNIKRKMIKENKGHIFVSQNGILKIKGKLIGGCLDTIYSIKDNNFFPKISLWENAIIFLETSEEMIDPKTFRKYLKKIEKEIFVSSGVIFGKPKNEKFFFEYLAIIKEILNNIKKPYVYNMNFGHTAPFVTIPYQRECTIDFKKKRIIISKEI